MTISPSNTQPPGRDRTKPSKRRNWLRFFDSIQPWTVLAMPRKPSYFSSKVQSGLSNGCRRAMGRIGSIGLHIREPVDVADLARVAHTVPTWALGKLVPKIWQRDVRAVALD